MFLFKYALALCMLEIWDNSTVLNFVYLYLPIQVNLPYHVIQLKSNEKN
uniref:Uncharacterized protein n=1 Tax=Setaria italica TaxID=4555 RepID=K3Y419_SETIT